MVKRRPPLVFLSVFGLSILHFGMHFLPKVLVLKVYIYIHTKKNNKNINNNATVYLPVYSTERVLLNNLNYESKVKFYTVIFIYYPAAYLVLTIGVMRFWLLYYDTHITKFNLQRAWLTAIDNQIETRNWFKQNENTWGNSSYGIKFCVITIISICILNALLRLLYLDTFQLMIIGLDLIVLLITAIFILIIWYKLKDFHHDQLFIRQEMMASYTCAFIMFITVTSLVIFWANNIISDMVYNIVWLYAISVGTLMLTLITTLYPRKQVTSQSTIADKHTPMCCCAREALCGDGGVCGVCGDCKPQPRPQIGKETVGASSGHNVITATNSIVDDNFDINSDISSLENSWSNIVCTLYGYEKFMNYLEKG